MRSRSARLYRYTVVWVVLMSLSGSLLCDCKWKEGHGRTFVSTATRTVHTEWKTAEPTHSPIHSSRRFERRPPLLLRQRLFDRRRHLRGIGRNIRLKAGRDIAITVY